MNSLWKTLAARFDALQSRERWLVVVALLSAIVLLGFTGVFEPALKRAQLADKTLTEAQAQRASIQVQLSSLAAASPHPDVAARAELEALRTKLGALTGRLQAMDNTLVAPQHMAGLLEEMIGRKSGLRVLSLKTLPVAPLLEKKKTDGEKAAEKPATAAIGVAVPENRPEASTGGLFRHGVEITLEGAYGDLAAYLDRLERSKMKLLWSSVTLSAEAHPRLVLTLTVYTLSLDRTWLIV